MALSWQLLSTVFPIELRSFFYLWFNRRAAALCTTTISQIKNQNNMKEPSTDHMHNLYIATAKLFTTLSFCKIAIK